MADGSDTDGRPSGLTTVELGVLALVVVCGLALLFSLLSGLLAPTYFLFLVGLAGMYALLSLGLNAQWGYTGLINFSVAAFFGIGAYGAALASGSDSPLAGGLDPMYGLAFALVLATVLALLIGLPTLRLRADYLAIASLGLAEVVRLIVLNRRDLTNGSAGIRGIPGFFDGWPVLSTFPETMPGLRVAVPLGPVIELGTPFYRMLLNVLLVLVFVGVSYAVLSHAHRSPWGRVLRTIRADEDLARALGKNTYAFKLQAFVLGSLVMALAGVFYAHLNFFVNPKDLGPITTFYVWVAVILGGTGSTRGAVFGGVIVVTIREAPRFLPLEAGAFRLLAIGTLIVVVMWLRPQGVLPPQRELIWPSAVDEAPERPDTGVREARGGSDD